MQQEHSPLGELLPYCLIKIEIHRQKNPICNKGMYTSH